MKKDISSPHMQFFNCQSSFVEVSNGIKQIYQDTSLPWINRFDITLRPVNKDFFVQFPKVYQIIQDFKCNTYAIFRFNPHTCYGWHTDNSNDDKGRSCSLNMLIEGYGTSHTFVGNKITGRIGDDFSDVREVTYEPNKFVLLDVNSYHTIFNLEQPRYLLTIGFPPATGKFDEIRKYLIANNF